MSEAKVTTNHDEIKKWVEARGGKPAHVKSTGRSRDPGILRVDYPGFAGEETLEPLSWDAWLRAFDAHNLAFVYQDTVKGGKKSRFSKLVSRDSVATGRRGSAAKRTTAKRATSTRSAAKRSTAKRSAKKSGAAKRMTKRMTKRPSTGRTTRTTRKTPRAAAGRMSKRPSSKKRASSKKSAKKSP